MKDGMHGTIYYHDARVNRHSPVPVESVEQRKPVGMLQQPLAQNDELDFSSYRQGRHERIKPFGRLADTIGSYSVLLYLLFRVFAEYRT